MDVHAYYSGVNNKFDPKIVTSPAIENVKDALEQFSANLAPIPISATTAMYNTAGDCTQWNAACLQLVNSDFHDYEEKLNAVYDAYKSAAEDPGDYSRITYAAFVQPIMPIFGPIVDKRKVVWTGAVGKGRFHGKSAKQTFENRRDTYQQMQNALSAWWVNWGIEKCRAAVLR